MFWWTYDTQDVAGMIEQVVDALKEDHVGRHQLNLDMLRMYSQRDYMALDRFDPSQRASTQQPEDFRMRLNVIGSMVDTVTSKIAKARPRPMYLTKRGDYRLRQRARRLTDMMEGIFHQTNLYKVMPRVFLDSCIFDLGVVKIGRDEDQLYAERVFPNEILWNLEEAMHSPPRSLHQVKQLHVEEACAMFPEHEAEIRTQAENLPMDYGREETGIMEIIESWYLSPSKEEPGRHVISVGNITLHDEDYDYDQFPFVFLRWGEGVVGFSGISLSEQLKSVQFEINRLALRIQQSMHLLSVPFIFLQMGSKVAPSHIRNVPGTIISYIGQPPVSYTPQAMHPEVYAHLDRLYQRAYEIAGVSELSASGKKPAGLESGAALRIYNDIQTERFITVGQRYEEAFMDCAGWFMDLAEEIVEESGKFPVRGVKDNVLEELDFNDLQMAQDDFMLQPYPVSLLPSTPAGRLQAVTELINSGVIDKREHIVRLLDFPDLSSVTSIYEGFERDVEWRITEIVESGIYHGPNPYMDLNLAVERFRLAYLEAEQDGLEQNKLNLLQTFIDEAMALMQPAPGQEAPGAPTPEAAGGGGIEAMMQSLMPAGAAAPTQELPQQPQA